MRRICLLVLGASLLGFGVSNGARAEQLPGSASAQAEGQIQSRFMRDADLKNNKIKATVDNGIVTLKGTVDSENEKARAAKLAMVGGVNEVDNQLKVGSATAGKAVSDSTITARLKTEMLAEDALRSVKVETNNAVVVLKGTVASEAAHMRAVELAQSMSGVSRVEDNIKIVP